MVNMKQISAIKKAGNSGADFINVFIEISKGGSIKYEFDDKFGCLVVDRSYVTAFVMPYNYGFVPNTLTGDGDPTDVFVISESAFLPGSVVTCKIIGLLKMRDEKGEDNKLICVPEIGTDPIFGNIEDIQDLPSVSSKLLHMMKRYKELESSKFSEVVGMFDRKHGLGMLLSSIQS